MFSTWLSALFLLGLVIVGSGWIYRLRRVPWFSSTCSFAYSWLLGATSTGSLAWTSCLLVLLHFLLCGDLLSGLCTFLLFLMGLPQLVFGFCLSFAGVPHMVYDTWLLFCGLPHWAFSSLRRTAFLRFGRFGEERPVHDCPGTLRNGGNRGALGFVSPTQQFSLMTQVEDDVVFRCWDNFQGVEGARPVHDCPGTPPEVGTFGAAEHVSHTQHCSLMTQVETNAVFRCWGNFQGAGTDFQAFDICSDGDDDAGEGLSERSRNVRVQEEDACHLPPMTGRQTRMRRYCFRRQQRHQQLDPSDNLSPDDVAWLEREEARDVAECAAQYWRERARRAFGDQLHLLFDLDREIEEEQRKELDGKLHQLQLRHGLAPAGPAI
jgi:hypothetical protein